MHQLSIFDQGDARPGQPPPRARRDDPKTSQLAAAAASTLSAVHMAKILTALDQGDGTIHELAERTGLTHVQVARRMPELGQLVRDTGATRPSPSGRACRVWTRCA